MLRFASIRGSSSSRRWLCNPGLVDRDGEDGVRPGRHVVRLRLRDIAILIAPFQKPIDFAVVPHNPFAQIVHEHPFALVFADDQLTVIIIPVVIIHHPHPSSATNHPHPSTTQGSPETTTTVFLLRVIITIIVGKRRVHIGQQITQILVVDLEVGGAYEEPGIRVRELPNAVKNIVQGPAFFFSKIRKEEQLQYRVYRRLV
jgi:hypothetical protein